MGSDSLWDVSDIFRIDQVLYEIYRGAYRTSSGAFAFWKGIRCQINRRSVHIGTICEEMHIGTSILARICATESGMKPPVFVHLSHALDFRDI